MRNTNKFLLVSLSILLLASTARFFDNTDSWAIDILSHFPFQYAVLAFLILGYCLWKKFIPLALFAGGLLLFNAAGLINVNESVHASVRQDNAFKICSANINKANRDFPKIINELSRVDADILLLLEITDNNIKPLRALTQKYPYQIENLNIGCSGTGTVLVSKFPILESKVTQYSEFGNMLVAATLEIDGKQAMFYGVHFPKPTDITEFPARSRQIMSLAHQVREQSLPVIIAGDFNSTPYAPIFRELVKVSGTKDSRERFGWLPSWPTFFPLFWIPIDHILVSPDIQVRKRTTGAYTGSDHYPVIAELSLGLNHHE